MFKNLQLKKVQSKLAIAREKLIIEADKNIDKTQKSIDTVCSVLTDLKKDKYSKHDSFAKAPASGGNGLGIAGTKGGMVEIDNVTIWSVKADEQSGWAAKLASFPKFQPVEIPKGRAKAKAERAADP